MKIYSVFLQEQERLLLVAVLPASNSTDCFETAYLYISSVNVLVEAYSILKST